MAEENNKTTNTDEPKKVGGVLNGEEKNQDSSVAKAPPKASKERLIVAGKAFVVSGQTVKIEGLPKKVKAGSEVVLEGLNLKFYDRLALRVAGAWYRPKNLVLARTDGQSIEFTIPDFDEILGEGDPIWVGLFSSYFPQASGVISRYIPYSFGFQGQEEGNNQSNEKFEEEAEGKKQHKGLQSGAASLVIGAAGEAMSGSLAPFVPAFLQKSKAIDAAKKALEENDLSKLKEAVKQSSGLGDLKGLRELSKSASGGESRRIIDAAMSSLEHLELAPEKLSESETRAVESEKEIDPISGDNYGDMESGLSEAEQPDDGTVAGGVVAKVSKSQQTIAPFVLEASGSGGLSVATENSVSANEASEVLGSSSSRFSGTVDSAVSGQESSASAEFRTSTRVQGNASVRQSASSRSAVGGSMQTGEELSEKQIEPQPNSTATTLSGSARVSGKHSASGALEESSGSEIEASLSGGGLGDVQVSSSGNVPSSDVQEKSGSSLKPSKPVVNPARPQERVSGRIEAEVPVGSFAGVDVGVEAQAEAPEIQRVKPLPVKNPTGSVSVELQANNGPSRASSGKMPEKPGTIKAAEDALLKIGSEAVHKPAETEASFEEYGPDQATLQPGGKIVADIFKAREASRNQKTAGVLGIESRLSLLSKPQGGRKHGDPRPGRVLRPGSFAADGLSNTSSGEGEPEEGVVETGSFPLGGFGGQAGREEQGLASEQADEVLGGEKQPSGRARFPEMSQPAVPARDSAVQSPDPISGRNRRPGKKNIDERKIEADSGGETTISQALDDRFERLAEDKTVDAEIKQVTREANLVVNQGLMEAATWVWATALPSFGLSVLLGAIIGDFLWAFKNGIIKRALAPLLKTEALKKQAEKIAKEIKINAAVKLNILGMNLVVAAAVLLILFAIFAFLWVGCNYPPGVSRISYKASVVGALGGSSICESIDSMTSNFSFGGGSSGGAGASGSWGGACEPLSSGPASVSSLANTCFGANADKASAIAGAESGGDPFRPSGVDKCTVDGAVVSWGLFQINISAQNNFDGLNCRSAFDKMYTAQSKDCRVVNKPLYDQCVAAAKDAQKNIQKACQMSNNGTSWSLWGANKKCGF